MLVSEFTELTGYAPTVEEYNEIESLYYAFDGDKFEFCKAWAKFNPDKAGAIWRAQKAAEIREKEINRVLRIVRRYIFNKKSCFASLQDGGFQALFNGTDREIRRYVIFSLPSWRGVTQNWCGDAVWRNFWDLHTMTAYGL